MRIKDNSGGFWTDIIVKRKSPLVTVRQNYIPDENVARVIAKEAVSAIKGSNKGRFSVSHRNGKLTVSRFSSERYSTGILQRKSPNGKDYLPLSEATLQMRKLDGNNRGPSFILRETGKHIMDGLKVLSISKTRNGSKAEVGWSGDNAQRAAEHNAGFIVTYTNKRGEQRSYDIPVPARPFIGLSKEFLKNINGLWNRIAKVK